MQMKTFRAANSANAFSMVKAELGEDAVIISNKTVDNNGRKCCEIVAAVDSTSPGSPKDSLIEDAMQQSVGWRQEWGRIKGQLMALMKPQMDLDRLTSKQRVALEYLEREEVDARVLASTYLKLLEDSDKSILPVLESVLKVQPFIREYWQQKIHVFAGPNGVGKTTSLVRLALLEKKRNPKARICLVCADGGRGKGRLVLKHYAELSGLGYREILTRDDFPPLLKETEHFDLIFIDLPGLSGSITLNEWLSLQGITDNRDMAVHLVLNPHFGTSQMERFLEQYQCQRLMSIIWTKLDEACTFGGILNVASDTSLPVSALAYGPGLKNTMAPAGREKIWRLLFMRQMPGNSDSIRGED